MEQDERQVQISAGDITLLDASRPCSLYWQESSKQISLLLPRTLLEQYFPHQNLSAQRDWLLTYLWCNSVIACCRRA